MLVPEHMMDHLTYLGNPLHYLRHFCNIGYFLGVIPFRFRFSKDSNCYEIVRNPWQKMLCSFIYGIAILEELRYIRDLIKEISNAEETAVNYFKIAYIGSEILCFITIFVTFWHKASVFKNVMNLLHKKSFESTKGIANAQLWTPIALVILFMYTSLFFLQRFSDFQWDFGKISAEWVKGGVRLLFLDYFLKPPLEVQATSRPPIEITDEEPPSSSTSSTLLGDFPLQSNVYNNPTFRLFFQLILYFSITALLFVLTLGKILLLNSMFCLNSVVKEFKDKVFWRCLSSTDMLIEYKEVEEITTLINKAVGLLIFGSIMAMFPYFVTGLVEVLVELMSPDTNIFASANHILEITHLFTFLIFSANINKRASKIEEWILETQDLSHLNFQEFNILIHKIAQSNIGLDAAGFFKVNNGFLGKIIGLLLTFAVIFIQFKTT